MSTSEKARVCGTCNKFSPAPLGNMGTCHAHPPLPVLIGHVKQQIALGQPQPIVHGFFPVVSKDDWCFEHNCGHDFVASLPSSTTGILLPKAGAAIGINEDEAA